MHRLVIALVTLIGLVGAAFVAGYFFLFSAATDRAATLAPANTALYVNVYLQPSTGQQMNLGGLIGRLPGFADESSLDEKVDQVVQNLLSQTGLDYREQIKPWLGNQVALAIPATAVDDPDTAPVVIAEVKDRDAAEAAIAGIAADGSGLSTQDYDGVELQVAADSGTAYGFVDEMLVVAPGAEALHGVIDVANGDESLGSRPDFRNTMDGLEADHLASAFVDIAAFAAATGTEDQISGVSTAGAVLVAEREGLRLSGFAPFDDGDAAPSDRAGFALGGEPSSLSDWMPESTLGELVVFGLRQTLEDAEAAIGEVPEGEDVASTLDTIRALAAFGLGIDLDADVLPLLDREVAVAITGFDGELPSGQLLLRPEDPDAAAASLDRIAERLGAVGASTATETVGDVEVTILTLPDTGEVAYAVVDGIVIIGFGVDDVVASIEAHESGRTLGGSAAYERTFEVAGTRAGNEGYVDVGAVVDLLGGTMDLPPDARDILSQVGTFGFTAPSHDHQIEFHAVLTVEDRSRE
jgi:Protein of unknown function (DUF3352)